MLVLGGLYSMHWLLQLLTVVLAEADTPSMKVPYWTASKPDKHLPDFGWTKVKNRTDSIVYFPNTTDTDGMYNHAAMLQYFRGAIHISWKNAPESEDTPGQRVLYSYSTDGVSWSKAELLFPNMSSEALPAAQFAGPFATLNGRLYASSTPAVIADGDAQGAQFCLWPDGLEPRNCATPDRPGSQPKNLLQMREIKAPGVFGDTFWVYDDYPSGFESVSKMNGIKTLSQMDRQTQQDVGSTLLSRGVRSGFEPPCENGEGTLKCEACKGGCQVYNSTGTIGHGIANERTHYSTPGSESGVILFRAHSDSLWASVRTGYKESDWSRISNTNIPNDNSNLNAGPLPSEQGIYLLHNAAPADVRDPLTLSLSKDGFNFESCRVIQTCRDIAEGRSTCKARQKGNGNVGPSYPQGLGVVDPAPPQLVGFYVVATNNKEDVIVTRVPWASVLEPL